MNKLEKDYASLTSKLIERGLTISTMESCTAGLIATLITNLDGSSKAMIGVGVTGSLGIVDPDNSDSVPGEVYFAIDFRGKIYDYYLNVPNQGSKYQNKFYVAREICSKLLEIL